jgi:hypothetical protein
MGCCTGAGEKTDASTAAGAGGDEKDSGTGTLKVCTGEEAAGAAKEEREGSLPSAGWAGAGDVAGACRAARYWGEPRSSCTSNCSVRDTPVGDRSLKNVSVRVDPGGPRIKSRSSWSERPRTAAPLTLTMMSRGHILPQRSALPPGTLQGMVSGTRQRTAAASMLGRGETGAKNTVEAQFRLGFRV